MLYWLYDIPTLLTVALFAAVFVGVCWLGTIVSRSFVRSRFHKDRGMNEILGDFLQYFGVIYGLLLGLLAVATYQNHTDVEKAVAARRHHWPRSTATSVPIPSRIVLISRTQFGNTRARPSRMRGRYSERASILGRSTALHPFIQDWANSSRRPKGRKRCTMRRFGNSMNSSRIAGCASTVSPPAFL